MDKYEPPGIAALILGLEVSYPRMSAVIPGGVAGKSNLLQYALPALPGVLAGLAIVFPSDRIFAGAHEPVAGAGVDYRLECFADFLHECGGLRKGSVDAGVVAAVEAVDRAGDL